MAVAGMAHDSAGICHAVPIALYLCFRCNCLDMDTLAVEIRPALRMDSVIFRIHMRRSGW